jgi:hypothetical protein
MANWDDVARLALTLPEVSESTSYGSVAWKVRDKTFVWERPLRQKDRTALGDSALAEEPILGVRVADLGEKEAVLGTHPHVAFTIPHFDGYPAVLVRLARMERDLLSEFVVDAWLARAPKRLAASFLGRDS